MIVRCDLPRVRAPERMCGGLVGGAPPGALVVGVIRRIEEVSPGNFAMRCQLCCRWIEIRPPGDSPGADAAIRRATPGDPPRTLSRIVVGVVPDRSTP